MAGRKHALAVNMRMCEKCYVNGGCPISVTRVWCSALVPLLSGEGKLWMFRSWYSVYCNTHLGRSKRKQGVCYLHTSERLRNQYPLFTCTSYYASSLLSALQPIEYFRYHPFAPGVRRSCSPTFDAPRALPL